MDVSCKFLQDWILHVLEGVIIALAEDLGAPHDMAGICVLVFGAHSEPLQKLFWVVGEPALKKLKRIGREKIQVVCGSVYLCVACCESREVRARRITSKSW